MEGRELSAVSRQLSALYLQRRSHLLAKVSSVSEGLPTERCGGGVRSGDTHPTTQKCVQRRSPDRASERPGRVRSGDTHPTTQKCVQRRSPDRASSGPEGVRSGDTHPTTMGDTHPSTQKCVRRMSPDRAVRRKGSVRRHSPNYNARHSPNYTKMCSAKVSRPSGPADRGGFGQETLTQQQWETLTQEKAKPGSAARAEPQPTLGG